MEVEEDNLIIIEGLKAEYEDRLKEMQAKIQNYSAKSTEEQE